MAELGEIFEEDAQGGDSESNVTEKMTVPDVKKSSDNENLESSMSINNNGSKTPSINGSIGAGAENEKEEEEKTLLIQSKNVDNEGKDLVGGDNEMKKKVDNTDGDAGQKNVLSKLQVKGITDDLIDPSLGYLKESNLKHPIKGFLEEEEDRVFTQIYDNSTVLIEIVRKLERQEVERITKLVKSYGKPVEVPRRFYKMKIGSAIYLKYLSSEERQKRAKKLKRFRKAIMYDPKCTSYPPQTFELYKKPFELGWKREYVMRSNTGLSKKTGDVYYYPPDGGKLRSSRELAVYLSKNPQHSMLSLDHFSFSKLPVGINDTAREMVRTAYDGKESLFRKGGPLPNRKSIAFSAKNPAVKRQLEGLPHLSPQVKKSSTSTPNSAKRINVDSPSNVQLKSSSSRRSIQPPKRYAGVNQPQEKKQRGTKREREESFEDSSLMEMEMGMLPPQFEDSQLGSGKNPEYIPEIRKRGRPFSKFDPRQMNEFNFSPGANRGRQSSGISRGRGRKAGGRDCHEASYNNYEGDGMFQISAIHKNHQSMLFSAMGNLENENAWKSSSGSGNIADDGELLPSKTEELLPCSIRCPGMTGDVPTLQCKRCLCLYHPACLGYPTSINIPDFICSNCEDDGIKSPVKMIQQQKVQQQQKPPVIGKQPGIKSGIGGNNNKKKPLIPPLVRGNKPSSTAGKFRPPNVIPPRIPQLQQAEASRSSPNRLGLNPRASMINSGDGFVKRGRGRPPKGNPILSNLTITPISQRKVKVPSVPKLNPVSVRPYSTSMGLRGIPLSSQKDQQLSFTTFNPTKLAGNEPNSTSYKKFPQSVVTIGQKQFIAIPNLSSPVPSNNRSSSVSVSKVKSDNKLDAAPPVLAKKSVVSFTGSDNNGENNKGTKTMFAFGNERVRTVQDMTIEKVDEEKVDGEKELENTNKEPKCKGLRKIPNEEEYFKEHPTEKEIYEKANPETESKDLKSMSPSLEISMENVRKIDDDLETVMLKTLDEQTKVEAETLVEAKALVEAKDMIIIENQKQTNEVDNVQE